MVPLLPIAIIFAIVEGIWTSVFFTRKDEAVKKLTLVNERFTAPSIVVFITLTIIAIALNFLALGYVVNDVIAFIAIPAFVYLLVSFTGSPTILGNFLGI